MAFDSATLLSRTTAGDAELSIPTNGLSLSQRKLLTYLDQPQALEELAAERALAREKLDRDLTKLASINLIAIDGQYAPAAVASIVLGGWRVPSMLRWILPPLLLLGAVLVYFGLGSATSRKADTPAVGLANTAPAVDRAQPLPSPVGNPKAAMTDVARAGETAVRDSPADVPPAPRAPRVPTRAGTGTPGKPPDPLSMAKAAPKPAFITESVNQAVEQEPVVPAAPAMPLPSARADATAPHSTPASAAVAAAEPLPVKLEPPVVTAAAALPAPSAARTRAAAGQPAAPAKLAMAAPNSIEARPPAATKLLPLTRDDPEFPREAISRGVSSGTVKARLSIDASGKVSAVNIVDSRPGHVFDRAVTQALSRWTFAAGDAGRSTEVEIEFRRD